MTLLALIKYFSLRMLALTAIFWLCPHAHATQALEVADASAFAAATEAPLYQVDTSGERTVLALVATAAGESSMRSHAVGDGGKSFGYFQIWKRPNMTPREQAVEALRQMRVSLAMCDDFTAYLAGRCDVPVAHRIAEHRADEARFLFTEIVR